MYSGDAPEKLQYTSKEWVGKPWSNDVPPPAIEQRRSGKPGRRWTRVSWLEAGVVRCQERRRRRRREQATGDGQTDNPKNRHNFRTCLSVPSPRRTHLPVTWSHISPLQLFPPRSLKILCISSKTLPPSKGEKEHKVRQQLRVPCLSSSAPLSGAG